MPAGSSPAAAATPVPEPVRRIDWPGLAGGAILAAGTIAIYWRTFADPLLLDDRISIADNPSIRRLWPILPVLNPPDYAGDGGRPLINFSYALNYAFGGKEVWGYHLVNLLIHLLAGWVLFGLVRRTLRRPMLAGRFGAAATPLSLVVSAIWAWHPVQTESVTYVTQRCESLMGLFYLLMLYCFLRGAEAAGKGGSRTWFAFSVLACLAGVASKEVIATAPLLALLYDRTFVSGSFSGAWRRHRPVYLALAATWIPLGFLMAGLRHRGVGFGQGVAWWAYGLTECRVVARYVLLSFWPHPLVFDYGTFETFQVAGCWPYALVLALLLAAAIAALQRAPAAGFAACWFLLILAPTSSVVPLAGQPMADHRLYLPLAGVASLVVVGAFARAGRRSLLVLAGAAVGLGLASARRNSDYASEQAIWNDTVAKSPANPRAHNNLGVALEALPGRLNDATAQFEEAVRLKPDYAEARDNLGVVLGEMPGRSEEAIAQFEEAVRLKPDYPNAHNDLGGAWSRMPGRLEDAVAQFEEAIRLRPDYAEAHGNLGNALLEMPGRTDEAIAQFGEAIRLKPDLADAHYNLANALSRMPGRTDEAVAQYREAIRLGPDDADARYNLGVVLGRMPGRLEEAIAQYREALRLKPDHVEARNNLGNAFLGMPGRIGDAIAQFREAVRRQPDHATAHFNLAIALLNTPGGEAEAADHLEIFLRLRPGDERARRILAQLRESRR